MRVLFVSATFSNFFAIDNVVRELFDRGHEVHLIAGMQQKRTISADALQKARSDLPGLVVRPLSARKFMRGVTRNLREVLNYAHVLNNEEKRQWDVSKWDRFIPPWLWRVINNPSVRKKLKDPGFQRTLRRWEQKIPIDGSIRKEIAQCAPDVVVLMPLVNPDSLEVEYLRAAQSLGIPTVYAMVSWDNISSKGTFHGKPDYSIVWNKPLADELARLHDVPRERIFFTGAPRFEHLFDTNSVDTLSREAFSQRAGIDPQAPYILYVCSTFLVNSNHKKEVDESILILDIARALQNDPRTRGINLLVRPHPVNPSFVSALLSAGQPNVFVYPAPGEIPDTEEKRTRYYNSIRHAVAVAGVNTTAFLEASALNRPCITVYSDQFSETQEMPHFHHLTDGAFLESAHGVYGLIECVANIVGGADKLAAERRAFVKNFLRPCEDPAPQVFVDVLERIVLTKV